MNLTAEDWRQIEDLYPRAAAASGEARRRVLDAAGPPVRAEIEAMLATGSDSGDILSAPVALTAESMAELIAPGTLLGNWRVKALVGTGGMGEVYLAERADGAYAMHAAVKVLRAELLTPQNSRRFLRERHVLARLSHPNVARVLDAGTSEDGRPFLVMEYVQGARITDYARARELPAREAARLMLAVAEAVGEAHRHGIVHRDLKPANVLVTAEGQVKLLDFGVARLLDEDEGPDAPPMTPAYAAPEQIRGEAVSPATDVYALGVMLFQLLTYRLPHLREGLPLPMVAANLRAETVERPSQVVLGTEGVLPPSARQRQASALSGDLDYIVLQALEGAGARRYPGAAEFAADLRRYLAHQPVRARPDSLAYRASRFARRYPTQVAAAGVAILALAAGLAVALAQARVARTEAARAERVKEFVLSVFREQDPIGRGRAAALTPAQIIAAGIARADEELAGDASLHADVLADLGGVQAQAIDAAEGVKTLQRALDERRRLGGDDLPQAATLVTLARAEAPASLDAARGHLAEARAILERHGALDSLLMGELEMQAAFVDDYGKAQGAQTVLHLRAAQRILEARLGPDDPRVIRAIFLRGQALAQARQDDEALAVQREAIARIERSAGPDSAQLINPLANLADIGKHDGSLDMSVQALERAIPLARRHYGAVSVELADMLGSLAGAEHDRLHFEKAAALFREAEAALPPDARHQRADLLKNRGQLALDMRRFEDAERDLRESYGLFREQLGDKNGFSLFIAAEWGRALAGLGRFDEAVQVQREALAGIVAALGDKAYQVSLVAWDLADTLERRGRWREAIELRRRVLALRQAKYPAAHRLVASARVQLANALVRAGVSSEEPGALVEQALPSLRAADADPRALALGLAVRGRVALAGGRRTAAREAFLEAADLYGKSPFSDQEYAEIQALIKASG